MRWFTDDVQVPPGLVAAARRNDRRRRRARIGFLATGTAVASATAVLIATTAAAQAPTVHANPGRIIQAQTTARVVSQVERALARTALTDPVEHTTQTVRGHVELFVKVPSRGFVEVPLKSISTWSRGAVAQADFRTRAGQPDLVMQSTVRASRSIQVLVSYPDQAWWRSSYQAPPSPTLKPGCGIDDSYRTPRQWAAEVRKLLSCGTATITGHQRIDGIDTIRPSLHNSHRRACAAADDNRRCQPQYVGWSGTLWVSQSGYLPVRLTTIGFRLDFRWLPPTPANLARLRLRIPAGFQHV